MAFSLHINEIHKRVLEYGPYDWINPKYINGLNNNSIKAVNKERWFEVIDVSKISDDDTDDEMIVDYLEDCFSQQINNTTDGENILQINGMMFIQATTFLICELASSYAATHLAKYKTVINEGDAQDCMNSLIDSYKNIKELHIKDIFRDFILEIFEYGPLWESKTNRYKYLDQYSKEFLHQIFKKGYFTINNDDGRYFSDGRYRFST